MRIVFMGSPEFALPSLRGLVAAGLRPELVVTQPRAQRRRNAEPESTPVGKAALELGLPLLETENACIGPDFERLAAAKPDLIVVVAFGQILRQNVLELARYGCINVHPSLLPKYRGAAPVAWAIMDGVRDSGISIIKLVKRLDAGPIVAQAPFAIGDEESAVEANARAAVAGAELLVRVVQQYAAEQPPSEQAQDDAAASYAGLFTKEHGRIDFARPAEQVKNHIRAVQPWPRANVEHVATDGTRRRLIIHRAQVLSGAQAASAVPSAAGSTPPGAITAVGQSGIDVACASGVLRITELQREGHAKQVAAEFVKGYAIRDGDKLEAPSVS